MLKFYLIFSVSLFVLGVLLLIAGFFTNISFWYGMSFIKSGGYLTIFGIFVQIIQEVERRKTEGV